MRGSRNKILIFTGASSYNSFIKINEPKMYSILILPEYTEKILTLLPQEKEISVFAFTFGSYEEGF